VVQSEAALVLLDTPPAILRMPGSNKGQAPDQLGPTSPIERACASHLHTRPQCCRHGW
jgi:hypothetical protein